MKTYILTFEGRQRGAIGAFYNIKVTVEADCEETVKQKLFDNDCYEFNHIVSIVEKPLT